jgi:multicomponent K+:H+ antiporter subunit E
MKRWLPFPLLSALLLAMWLALNETLAAGQVLLGVLLAAGAGLALRALQEPARWRRPGIAVALAVSVLGDILRSNLAVLLIVLFPRRTRSAGFVTIPLELRSTTGLAVLACIITATPGTAWARFDSRAGTLTIHVLDLIDEDAWIRTLKDRYERRLLEIFP